MNQTIKSPRLLILGHGRHGKDSAAEILEKNFGLSFKSSSMKAAELFLYDKLKSEYSYKNIEECYEDRNSSPEMRALWYREISAYVKGDKARLAKAILEEDSIYVGMRAIGEFEACAAINLFDLVIWVDASERLPLEGCGSMTIPMEVANVIVDNNEVDPGMGLLESNLIDMMNSYFPSVGRLSLL